MTRTLPCALAGLLALAGLPGLLRAQSSEPAAPAAEGGDPAADSSALALLALAEEAMTTLEYEHCRQLAARALERGGLDTDDVVRAYRLIAVAGAQLGDDSAAQAAFIRLFALDPDSNIAVRLSPQRRGAVLEARGFWATRKPGFQLQAEYARRERQVIVHVRDALGWAKSVQVWFRFGERRYLKVRRPVGPQLVVDVADIGPTDPLAVYAFAVDEHENVLLELGHEREPHVFGLSDEERAEFMRRDIRGGQPGSYARRLEELGVRVGVHGYLSLEFKPVNDTPSLDLHHATAMIRASLFDRVSLEIALEWEHLGRTQGDFYLPHAFMDIRAAEWLILRAGFFEMPVGAFNEYLYPDFLRITGLAPLFASAVVPALWSEVGLELRGRVRIGPTAHLTYAAVLSNGLEQPDEDPKDGQVAEGGEIRSMRFHARDQFSANKAVGGRVGLEVGDFDLGVSAYTGRYTIEAARQLSIGDVDFSYRGKWLTVRTEGAAAWQEITRDTLNKYGFYALVALRPIGYLEPYVQYDWTRQMRTEQRILGGLAIYPFPHEQATRNLRLKSEAGLDWPPQGKRQFVWFFQLTTGF